ncbi:MAG: tRNA pseudouridine(38-40) synthase TruA [Clostridia bacterium]|nr:tRNA pseudouridine(38-40) synthase TruA [Clostridia bacterium]
MKILLFLSYVGTAYCGYQVQKNGTSIQQRLNEAAKSLFGFDCDIVGCSRTDKGVHANEFCATVSKKGESGIESTIPEPSLPKAFNSYLPGDICIKSAKYVSDAFHPRYDVKFKEYVYKIYTESIQDPFLFGRVWNYCREIDGEALKKMNEAAAYFVGKHDFSAFMASGSSVSCTVREVTEAKVVRNGNTVEFYVAADGFLYNMVRIMTGTLIAVAEGKISPDEIEAVIASCDRSRAGMTAPPDGLYLNRVEY